MEWSDKLIIIYLIGLVTFVGASYLSLKGNPEYKDSLWWMSLTFGVLWIVFLPVLLVQAVRRFGKKKI